MAIAISEPVAEISSSTDADTYAFGSFTPSANAVLVAVVFATGTDANGRMNDGGAVEWTKETSFLYNGNADAGYLFWLRPGAAPGAATYQFQTNTGNATGCTAVIYELTGADVTTSNPIKQYTTATGTEPTFPELAFSTALGNLNGYGIAFSVEDETPTGSPPLGWTEIADTGYTSPTAGMVAAYRAGGETGTDFAYTISIPLGSDWAGIGFEVYVSGAGPAAFDPAEFPHACMVRQVPPLPPARSVMSYVAVPSDWTTFAGDTMPVSVIRTTPPVGPRGRGSVYHVKPHDAGSAQEQDQPRVTVMRGRFDAERPGRVSTVLPPLVAYNPAQGALLTTSRRVVPEPARAGQSRVAYLPEMSGPPRPQVIVVRPRIEPVRSTVAIWNPIEPPLPYPSRWQTIVARAAVAPPPPSRSQITNLTALPQEHMGAVFMSAPRAGQAARGSVRINYVSDFLSARLQALPSVVIGRAAPPPTLAGYRAVPLVTEPITVGMIPQPRAVVARPWFWQPSLRPQTFIAWVPQPISTATRKDDRDSQGRTGRSAATGGGGGRNRSSTGVGTQG